MIDNNSDQIQEEDSRPTYLSYLIIIVIGIILVITAVIFYPDARAQIESNQARSAPAHTNKNSHTNRDNRANPYHPARTSQP